ncbi:MAG: glycine zipper domain-containing protein [Alphaproteobacteria bacterium]|nr:glycine zipper domain-containing protein [Alphaproteobacteria bacterium]
MRTLRACVAGLLMIALAGCESGREKEVIGTLIGAAAGVLIGSTIGSGSGQAAAMGFGGMLGGMIGGAIGSDLDEQDRKRADRAARESIHKTPDGTSSTWVNPDSGNSGSYTPTGEIFTNDKGEPCRKVRQLVIIDEEETIEDVVLCEKADGSVVASN